MQIEEPNWVGQRARCEKCDIRITLEAGDKDKVEYLGYRWQRGHVPPGLTNMRLFRLFSYNMIIPISNKLDCNTPNYEYVDS